MPRYVTYITATDRRNQFLRNVVRSEQEFRLYAMVTTRYVPRRHCTVWMKNHFRKIDQYVGNRVLGMLGGQSTGGEASGAST